jgi:hypothetical protein
LKSHCATVFIYFTLQPYYLVFPFIFQSVKIKIYNTIILPGALHERVTLSLTLKEEHSLRVFENRVLRGIFGPERDEVTGDWRKLHSEMFNIRMSKSRRIGSVGHISLANEKCIQTFNWET